MGADKHKHIYSKPVLTKVRADNIKYTSDKPMAILSRKCECGQEQAFEYAERDVIQELYDKLAPKPKP